MARNGIELTPTKNQREKEKLHDESEFSTYNTLDSDNSMSITIENEDFRSQTSKVTSRKTSMGSDDNNGDTDNEDVKILDNSEIQIRILA
jgi:hypothetical protein